MTKMLRAILIDPREQRVSEIEWNGELDGLHALLDDPDGLSHFCLAEFEGGFRDHCWVDDCGLSRGEPVHAFLLPTSKDPIAGKCAVIGSNERGDTTACLMPIEILRQDVSWLGLIRPEVFWEDTDTGQRAIVTYSRVSK
jgi:hypothetical protein